MDTYEQTEATVRQACADSLSATIDRIVEAVSAFTEGASQGDDMTCVVLRIED